MQSTTPKKKYETTFESYLEHIFISFSKELKLCFLYDRTLTVHGSHIRRLRNTSIFFIKIFQINSQQNTQNVFLHFLLPPQNDCQLQGKGFLFLQLSNLHVITVFHKFHGLSSIQHKFLGIQCGISKIRCGPSLKPQSTFQEFSAIYFRQ